MCLVFSGLGRFLTGVFPQALDILLSWGHQQTRYSMVGEKDPALTDFPNAAESGCSHDRQQSGFGWLIHDEESEFRVNRSNVFALGAT
jgi:hypothetical protein